MLWSRERAPAVTLWAFLAVPVLGLLINTIAPPESNGYIQELSLLIAVALVALRLTQTTANGAVFLYCSLALVPVGVMLARYGDTSLLVLTPLFGIALVTLLTRDEHAVVGYGPIALIASLIFGVAVDDLGLGGALAFLSGGLTGCALWWTQDCNLKSELEEIQARQKDTDRSLRKITGELGR